MILLNVTKPISLKTYVQCFIYEWMCLYVCEFVYRFFFNFKCTTFITTCNECLKEFMHLLSCVRRMMGRLDEERENEYVSGN